MTRRNISLPDDLDEQARQAGLNVSALAREAIIAELDRRDRMAQLGAWLEELDVEHGPPSAEDLAEAREWLRSATPVGENKKSTGKAVVSVPNAKKSTAGSRRSTKKPRPRGPAAPRRAAS